MKTAIISLIVFYVVLELIVRHAEYKSKKKQQEMEEARKRYWKEQEKWSNQYRR